MTTRENTIYAGRDAYYMGKDVNDCPHHEGTWRHDLWTNGWNTARAEDDALLADITQTNMSDYRNIRA